uniref:Uncharacterized protein n=1 Tax=viral metagenome TaxID=1070528 RepID=A0A6C0I3B9_9ZZZZ
MSSTGLKSILSNYKAEQAIMTAPISYTINEVYGAPPLSCFPGHGLLPAKMPAMQLSNNSCDIESQLFGIGSANVVNPKPKISLSAKPIASLSIIKQSPILLYETNSLTPEQRFRYLW